MDIIIIRSRLGIFFNRKRIFYSENRVKITKTIIGRLPDLADEKKSYLSISE